MRNLMMGQFGQVTLNVSTGSDVRLSEETIVKAKLLLVLPTGGQLEVEVNEIMSIDLQSYDVETGLPIYSETNLNL